MHLFQRIASTEQTKLAPFSVQIGDQRTENLVQMSDSDASSSHSPEPSMLSTATKESHLQPLQRTNRELKSESIPKRRPQIIIKIYLQPTFESTSGYSTHETSSLTANSISIS